MGIKLVVHFYVFVQLRVSTSVAILSMQECRTYLEWGGRIKETSREDVMRLNSSSNQIACYVDCNNTVISMIA